MYDFDKEHLAKKLQFLITIYNNDLIKLKGKTKSEIKDAVDYSIKWSRAVINDLSKGTSYTFDKPKIASSLYRPFTKKFLYFSKDLNEMQYQIPHVFPNNKAIGFLQGDEQSFSVYSTDMIPNYAMFSADYGQNLPLYRYENGARRDNITDWGLQQFTKHYKTKKITKEDIFRYVYAVLHHPAYRTKYELNLKREFPRIPFYDDFFAWSERVKVCLICT